MNKCACHYPSLTLGPRSEPAISTAYKRTQPRPGHHAACHTARQRQCTRRQILPETRPHRPRPPRELTFCTSPPGGEPEERAGTPQVRSDAAAYSGPPPHPHRHTARLNSERGTGGRERNSLTTGKGGFSQNGTFRMLQFVRFLFRLLVNEIKETTIQPGLYLFSDNLH